MSEQFIVVGDDYKNWLKEVKLRIRSVQLKAAILVNRALLQFCWELGADIVQKQTNAQWGDGLLRQLSADLMAEFPEMKVFFLSNIKYVKKWYLFYNQTDIKSQQLVGQLPWRHTISIISNARGAKKRSLMFSRPCAERRG